ncbi:MAG: enhanced serine sensitivity protein SseB C-terminal domain-containing protein [Verrucomicrobiaceae bacterium]|nr:enhanced serine sensitivity protein SseB C-terminal domain-containing protein [Verrucomicrobiaceae bacterium]
MTPPAKGDFTPQNPLEEQLKRLLTDKNTPYLDFYMPLAASPLWIVVPHHPELDGTDLVAPRGQNPAVPVWSGPGPDGETVKYVGIYSSELRARKGVEMHESRMPGKMTCVSAKGHGLLRFMKTFGADILLNMGQKECQYDLDPDLIDYLLEQPEPPDPEPPRTVARPEGDPAKFLGPVKELLARDAAVRAAWIFESKPAAPLPRGHACYELALLMHDPDDEHLLQKVETMAKALTPVQMEWTTSLLRGGHEAFRELAGNHPPFYAARDFLP